MNIDEMILKANRDGKTYINSRDGYEYSRDNGFLSPKGTMKLTVQQACWEEKLTRHLTIREAEKELDCVIDVDFPK
ncbi:hypothetical protein [Lacrimispora sp.]|uniref:hypothetical protein n=1 Tax=Lacrimispora sp. TaxID=2719234 RepID=UPI0028A80FB7|nr:hypothetical protein [Lacrimispora sp.]